MRVERAMEGNAVIRNMDKVNNLELFERRNLPPREEYRLPERLSIGNCNVATPWNKGPMTQYRKIKYIDHQGRLTEEFQRAFHTWPDESGFKE